MTLNIGPRIQLNKVSSPYATEGSYEIGHQLVQWFLKNTNFISKKFNGLEQR